MGPWPVVVCGPCTDLVTPGARSAPPPRQATGRTAVRPRCNAGRNKADYRKRHAELSLSLWILLPAGDRAVEGCGQDLLGPALGEG